MLKDIIILSLKENNDGKGQMFLLLAYRFLMDINLNTAGFQLDAQNYLFVFNFMSTREVLIVI